MSHAPIRTLTNALLASSLGLGLTQVAHAQDAAPEVEEHQHMPLAPDTSGKEVQVESPRSWTDDIAIGAFVDAYAAYRSDNNTAPTPGSEAYVENNGFGLAFAGADIAYSGDQFGATMSLRFGPGVVRFYAADQDYLGIDNLTQAFVTWKPTDKLTLDLGQFNTIYGAEVTESWRNINYSRGALYYAFQPFWHTGLRANYAISDMIGVNALVVNGVNTAAEGNKSPSIGLQLTAAPMEELFLAVGYLGALHPRNGDEGPPDVDADGDGVPDALGTEVSKFEHFVDLVATYTAGDFKLVGNFDFNMYRLKGFKDAENNWGLSVAPAYAITNWFGVGARVEYLADSANNWLGMAVKKPGDSSSLLTATATLDFKPVPNSSALVLRPEFRFESASDDYFSDRDNKATDSFWVASLGAVVTSM